MPKPSEVVVVRNHISVRYNALVCYMRLCQYIQMGSTPCCLWTRYIFRGLAHPHWAPSHTALQIASLSQQSAEPGSIGWRVFRRSFAALVLKRLGHTVRIFERKPTPLLHNQGAGVVAGGDTQALFSKFDATKRSIAVTSKLRQYLDLQSNQIHEEETVQKMTSWDLLYYLFRANVDGVKSDYCQVPEAVAGEGQGTYEYGRLVKDIKDLDEKVEIEYETKGGNQDTTTADLVIGADGPSSTLGKILLPEVERKDVGYVAWRDGTGVRGHGCRPESLHRDVRLLPFSRYSDTLVCDSRRKWLT
jgi:hypothetical protein